MWVVLGVDEIIGKQSAVGEISNVTFSLFTPPYRDDLDEVVVGESALVFLQLHGAENEHQGPSVTSGHLGLLRPEV
jgi:hypothetical protein